MCANRLPGGPQHRRWRLPSDCILVGSVYPGVWVQTRPISSASLHWWFSHHVFHRGCHLGSAGVPITAIFCFIFYYLIFYFFVSYYHLLSVLTFGFRFLVADGCGQGCEFRCPFGVVPCALHMLMPIIDAPRPDVCYVQLVSEVCSNTRWRKAAECSWAHWDAAPCLEFLVIPLLWARAGQ